MTRREAVALVGLSGVALLSRRAVAQGTGRVPACVVRPQQTEGPYFVDEKLNRSDIRSDPGGATPVPGAPLELAFAVSQVDGGAARRWPARRSTCGTATRSASTPTCRPGFNTTGKKFLRGYQVTDANGHGAFTTIYPGWYQGRAVHIHFKIRTPAQTATSSPRSSSSTRLSPTACTPSSRTPRNGQRRLRNDGDGLFRSGGRQLLVTPHAERRGLRHDVRARAQYLDGQHLRAALPRDDVGRIARRRHRRGGRRLPAAAAALRGRHPARPRPPRARAERARHPAQGVRHRPDPERRLRGQDARHADQHAHPQRGHAVGRLPRGAARSTGRATPTTPTTRSTACATGAAAAGRARARRPGASRPAPSRASC